MYDTQPKPPQTPAVPRRRLILFLSKFLDKQTPRTNTASNGIGPSSIRPLLTQLAMSNPWPSQPTTPFVQVAASTHVSPIRTSGSSHPTIWSRR